MKRRWSFGFSLIEVLVFVSVVSLFFVSASAVVAIILRNMKTDEHKILGTRYAEEAVEWLRSEKETDWNAFTARASSGIGTDYCIATLAWSTPPPCGYNLDNFYKRTLNLVSLTSSDGFKYQVNAKIVVEWSEAGKIYTIPIDTVLSIWEQ